MSARCFWRLEMCGCAIVLAVAVSSAGSDDSLNLSQNCAGGSPTPPKRLTEGLLNGLGIGT